MRSTRRTLSRRELALVAAALLLPVPLLARSGLSLPLPNAVERSLGSLVTLEADDERSGARVTAQPEVTAGDTPRSDRGSVAIARAGGRTIVSEGADGSGSERSAGSVADDDGADSPAGRDPKGGDDTDDQSPGGTDAPADDGGDGSQAAPSGEPGASLVVAAPDASAGASVGDDKLSLDVEAGSASTGEELTGVARVEVTASSGSSTGVDVAASGARVSLP